MSSWKDIDARSIITFPTYPHQVEKGYIEIRGLAWSGRGKVTKVEVSTNGGKTWPACRNRCWTKRTPSFSIFGTGTATQRPSPAA